MKPCTKCLEPKPLTEFFNRKDSKDGKAHICKVCTKAANKRNYENNKEAHYERGKKWIANNKEKHEAYQRQYRKDNRERCEDNRKKWRAANPEKVRQHGRNQKAKNPSLRKARTNIYNGLKRGYTEKCLAYDLLGADYDTVWTHLKKTWERRYGAELTENDKYELDHIIPCSVLEDHHYSNLQLLTPTDNRRKFIKNNSILAQSDK